MGGAGVTHVILMYYMNIIHIKVNWVEGRRVFRLTSRGGQLKFFSLIQVQNLQVMFLVIFKLGESLILVVFFIYFLI
jgi:hypothetical protein